MTDPDETRTRAQLEATLKDELVVFNQHIRNINKPTRRIHAVSAKPNVVAEELQDCARQTRMVRFWYIVCTIHTLYRL